MPWGHVWSGRFAGVGSTHTNEPLITIVTIVFNCVETIEQTLLSVIEQTYKNIEYIVVDGGSTDGTVDVIRKYAQHIDVWISEKDKGIYNAMNKGIDISTGAWINFMNAGDSFESNETVERVVPALDPDFATVAGAVRYMYDAKHSRVKHMDLSFDRFPLVVPHHQASFINNRLMKLHKYDESFRIRGDLYFMTILYALGEKFRMVEEVVCRVDTNGVSAGASSIHISEEIRAGNLVIKHYRVKCLVYNVLYVKPRLALRKLLPKRIESKLRSLLKS